MLVVDDDLMNIEVLQSMLVSKGIMSESALDGKIALKMLQTRIEAVYKGEAQMYQIILLDYSMPELDGP